MWKPTSNGDFLMHYARGQRARNHKYIEIKDGRYIYPNTKTSHGGRSGSSDWSSEIYSAQSKNKKKTDDSKKKRTAAQQAQIDRINASGKKRTKYETTKAETMARKHKARNSDFTKSAKKNAGVNRSAAGTSRSATNAQMIKKNRKKENLIETGLRKLALNLKLLSNRVPGVVSLRKAHKKFKK